MQILTGEVIHSDLTKNARGGSELMVERLLKAVPKELLENFQIIVSRSQPLDESKVRVFWAHDLPGDPGANCLLYEGWKKFHKIVFVSYWQRQQFMNYYKIPHSKTVVIRNAIEPILGEKQSKSDKVRFIYHTTPHRGLDILVAVFDVLSKKYNIHLDVYSSFKVYGWGERDQQYKDLFDFIKNHEHMTYHGAVSNDEIRWALLNADIYAYPSTWRETSCLSLIEAMSAGVCCVHSDLAALPETSCNLTNMYGYSEDPNEHARILHTMLDYYIPNLNKEAVSSKTQMARDFINAFYNLNAFQMQWCAFLEGIKNEPRNFPAEEDGEYFIYTK